MPDHAVAQVFDGPGRPLRQASVALPARLEAGEVLVAIDLATVCGSDVHTVDGRRQETTPAVLGHEGVGRVVAVGAGRALREGDRVSWTIADSCGRCDFCSRYGLPEKCRRLFKYGHAPLADGCGLNGTYATHVVLRAGTDVITIDGALSDAVVAPANCALATVVNALRHVPAEAQSVWVQGAGLLGLYAVALLRERGVATVLCSDPVPARRALAQRFGATPVDTMPPVDQRRDQILAVAPDGVDAVLEVSGETSVVGEGLQLIRTGGVYVLVGMVHPDTDLGGITGEQIVRKCLSLRGVHNYSPVHLRDGLDFLRDAVDRFPFEALVSPAVGLADLDEAFSLSRQRQWMRVAVAPNQESP